MGTAEREIVRDVKEKLAYMTKLTARASAQKLNCSEGFPRSSVFQPLQKPIKKSCKLSASKSGLVLAISSRAELPNRGLACMIECRVCPQELVEIQIKTKK